MNQVVEMARVRADEPETATMCMEQSLTNAHLDRQQKGEALWRELMRIPRDQEAFDSAYAVWTQAKAIVVAIQADMKA